MTTLFDRLSDARIAQIDTWIFDLDNTLYYGDPTFFAQIDVKITDYVSQYLGLDRGAARKVQKDYLIDHGTTLSGLMAHHDMSPEHFMDYVHDVDLSMLAPNPLLRERIAALPGRKFIYTNGSKNHASNVAGHLNLIDLFDASFGVEDSGYIPKPRAQTYDIFNAKFNVDPARAIFFEDNVRNLEVPHDLGMATLLVKSNADFSHEPEEVRPGGASDEPAPYIDVITQDLAHWLGRVGRLELQKR